MAMWRPLLLGAFGLGLMAVPSPTRAEIIGVPRCFFPRNSVEVSTRCVQLLSDLAERWRRLAQEGFVDGSTDQPRKPYESSVVLFADARDSGNTTKDKALNRIRSFEVRRLPVDNGVPERVIRFSPHPLKLWEYPDQPDKVPSDPWDVCVGAVFW